MDFEKLAESTHQAWFVAMAKQGWIFGPRLNADFKTHPWLKPYAGLADTTKEIVRAQVRGTLAALESQGVGSIKGFAGMAASAPPAAPQPRPTPSAEPVARPSAPQPAAAAPPPVAAPVAPAAAPVAVVAPVATVAQAEDTQILERKIDASGRMRIGAGLVKKADLLPNGSTQVAILQEGNVIQVLPYDANMPNAFFASVNPDGFMLPKAMLSGMGAVDFILTITPGKLVVKPK